jgi:ACS family hexuronate transporter-like MFS transporter
LAVPWLLINFGWQMAFVSTGAVGLIWLVLWFSLYDLPERHPRVSAAELAYIRSDPPESDGPPIPWVKLFRLRQTWAFILPKFFTDAVWRWYLYLLPLFFNQNFNLDIRNFGLPFLTIYCMADIGSIVGGWLSSALVKRGWSVNAARKTVMLGCSLCVLPVMFSTVFTNMWTVVFFVGLAAAAHQGFSCNIFTIVSDIFPKSAIGSVVGIGGTAGALGAMGLLALTSRILQAQTARGETSGGFAVLFVIAGLAYLLAMVCLQVFAPRLESVRPDRVDTARA